VKRQRHLVLRQVRAGAGGEYVEDQLGAIDHPGVEGAFEVAALGGSQVVVEDDDLRLAAARQPAEFLGLAGAQEVLGIHLAQVLDANASAPGVGEGWL